MSAVGIGLRAKEIDIPKKNSQKIDRIIKDGVRLKKHLEDTKQEVERNNQLLIPHAENLAGISGQKTVGFQSPHGSVKVTFGDKIVYRESDMPKIKGILGPVFDQVFTRETTYAVSISEIPEIKRLLGKMYDTLIKEQDSHSHKKKIRDILSDGDSEVSKKLRKIVLIAPNKPSIVFNKDAG